MAELNETIHQPLRLQIMSALWAGQRLGPLEFSALKKIVGATDGNLGSHLTTLEKAGYVAIEKEFVGKRPRTSITLTKEGAQAFRGHVEYLRQIVESAEG
jgi:DNA-binding transcriptional ArsR family regulator